MEYEVQLAPLDKIATTAQGIFEPLCNTCTAPDCSNPIRDMVVSVIGIPKTHRVYVVNQTVVRQVVGCKGYIGNDIQPMGGQPNSIS